MDQLSFGIDVLFDLHGVGVHDAELPLVAAFVETEQFAITQTVNVGLLVPSSLGYGPAGSGRDR